MYEPGNAVLEDGFALDPSSVPAGSLPLDEASVWPAVGRVSATYIHAARIDESGLRALARRAREQALDQLDRTLPESVARSPRQPADPVTGDSFVPPGSRRSA